MLLIYFLYFSLEVCWGGVPTADAYLLQVQKYDMPPTATAAPTGKKEPLQLSYLSKVKGGLNLESIFILVLFSKKCSKSIHFASF